MIGEHWAQLVGEQADQLGGFRIGELSAALNALGIGAPVFLGGAGRWRDSGMKARRRDTGSDSSTPTRAMRSALSWRSSVGCGHTSSSPTTPTAVTVTPTCVAGR